MIKAVIMDFGGVISEEGFREGLKAIGRKNGLNPEGFFEAADELIYETGYVLGKAEEAEYWKALREKTGITGSDEELRKEMLKRFLLRPVMLEYVDSLRSRGLETAMLSDQTNWEEIEEKGSFFHHFDHVFNSFRLNKGKRDPSLFKDVCIHMGLEPREALFVDDKPDNVTRARSEGLAAVHFTGPKSCKRDIETHLVKDHEGG
jgi:putative hydrolase of the HAD superfamily